MANKDYRKGLDYSLIPETDLDAMIADDYASVSDATLDYLNDEGSSMDAFTANAGRAITSRLRGLGIYRPDEAEIWKQSVRQGCYKTLTPLCLY